MHYSRLTLRTPSIEKSLGTWKKASRSVSDLTSSYDFGIDNTPVL